MKMKIKKIENSKKIEGRDVKISFCIACMGRLHHIKKTLLQNIKNNNYNNVEFVLLNYNSKDGLDKWIKKNMMEYIESGILNYYHTTEPQYFHMSHAKNMSHKLASGTIVCNVDADNFTYKDFSNFVYKQFSNNSKIILCFNTEKRIKFLQKQKRQKGCGGRICVKKEYFLKAGGYDEEMIGWGAEDTDFVFRVSSLCGLKKQFIPSSFLSSISHDTKERMKNFNDDNIKLSVIKNKRIYNQHRKKSIFVCNKKGFGLGTVRKNFGKNMIVT